MAYVYSIVIQAKRPVAYFYQAAFVNIVMIVLRFCGCMKNVMNVLMQFAIFGADGLWACDA